MDTPTTTTEENTMGAVSYELNLEPVEAGVGWTAMIYRSVRAGVCGPWTDTVTLDLDPAAMFHPIRDLPGAALVALCMDGQFIPGPPGGVRPVRVDRASRPADPRGRGSPSPGARDRDVLLMPTWRTGPRPGASPNVLAR
jgi:hypothetical protein